MSITVERVEDRRLIRPIIKYSPEGRGPYTTVADAAEIRFDQDGRKILVHLTNARVLLPNGNSRLLDETFEFPLAA